MRFGVPFAGTDEQELLSAMVTASPTAITVVDLGGVVLLWNPAAERLFGWSADEVLGHPIQDIEFNSPAEGHRLRTGSAAGQDVLEVQARRRHRGGHLVHISVSTVGLHDPRGGVIAILGIYRDVPERKAAEEERVS
jgi:PAS domain S-box-containing protein